MSESNDEEQVKDEELLELATASLLSFAARKLNFPSPEDVAFGVSVDKAGVESV